MDWFWPSFTAWCVLGFIIFTLGFFSGEFDEVVDDPALIFYSLFWSVFWPVVLYGVVRVERENRDGVRA